MKIDITDGCICNSRLVDDVEFNDLPTDKKKEVIHKLVDSIDDNGILNNVFYDLVYEHQDTVYECLGECEECGDIIDNFKLTINDS